jgi:uncharacterized membrane protein YbhN (UPF0104 family)
VNGRIRLVLTIGGALLLALLVLHIGPATILEYGRRTGWYLLPIVLVFLPVYLCNAFAWYLVMARSPARPPFLRTFVVTVSGFAINYVTPVVSLGGEPFKVAAVAPWTGTSRATSSVIVFGMLHALSHLFIWLSAVVLALIVVPVDIAATPGLGAIGLLLLGLIIFVLGRHRHGILEDLLDLLYRVPLLRRAAKRWEPRRPLFARIDAQIAEFWLHDRARFFAALASEYVGRAISMVEFWLILLSLGYTVGYFEAFLIGSFASFVLNLLFFIPFALGAKESGVLAVVAALGMPAGAGFYASLLTRIREIVWIAIGLALIPLSGTRRIEPEPEPVRSKRPLDTEAR